MAQATAPRPVTRLKQVLTEDGRRQDWLARQIGISDSLLSMYVNGLQVPDDRKTAIAEALGRTVDDVFGEVRS